MSALPKIRESLANLSHVQLAKRAPLACRAAIAVGMTVLAMRTPAGAETISTAQRNEMLAACKAGEYVELEIDLLAYEQKTGVTNRNYVRFRDGALMALGRSGARTPLLRDHEQYDALARGGTIIASRTEKRDDGDYAIIQTAKLTAPWAVELALRGLLDGVSIGWNPTAPVLCSACDAAIFTRCYHFPGDRLAEVDAEGGGKRLVRKADGPIAVEWIFTEAELVETSLVSVQAVPSAHIEGIRAALASGPDIDRDHASHGDQMHLLAALVARLGLAATAGDTEVINAVEALKRERDTARSELGIAEAEVATLTAANDAYKAGETKAASDKFITDALSSGRIAPGDEDSWRDLYELDSKRATERMSKRKAGSVTPVGRQRQSEKEPAEDKGADTASQKGAVKTAFEGAGVNYDAAKKFAAGFGATKFDETAAKALGLGDTDESEED